jgi:putative dimethyl sulfoxide reductase chaperone
MENNAEMSAQMNDWTDILTAEALAFGFINRVFYEKPAQEFIQPLISEKLFDQWPLLTDDEFTASGLDILQAFSGRWEEVHLADLKKDYQQLFIGPDHLPAPPWESVYLSIEGLVFEKETMAVRQFYARYGLQIDNLYKEPDDHFGLEMAFMAHLCTLGLQAISTGDVEALQSHLDAQRDFLQEHLLLWAPEFLNSVIAHARTDYYRGAAYLALGCLAEASARRDLEVDLALETG